MRDFVQGIFLGLLAGLIIGVVVTANFPADPVQHTMTTPNGVVLAVVDALPSDCIVGDVVVLSTPLTIHQCVFPGKKWLRVVAE